MSTMQADPNNNSTTMADGTATTNNNVASIVTDALNQQASQFETLVQGLQAQIASLVVKKPAKAKPQKATAPARANPCITPAPAPRKGPRASTSATSPAALKSPPKTPKTPTPTPPRKQHPLQVKETDYPADFKSTKVGF